MPSLVIILLCLCPALIHAETIKSANAHWPPWRVFEADGRLTGIEVDILEQLSEYLQLSLVTKGCGWNRCLKHMQVGESDIMTGVYKTPEREQYMTFIEPPYYTTHGTCFYINKTKPISINSYLDLQKLTIGVVKNVSYFEPFDSDQHIQKYASATGDNLFRLLQAKRIDVFAMACVAGDVAIKAGELSEKIERADYIYRVDRPVYLAISKKSRLIKRQKEIAQILQHMLAAGKIEQIMASYGVINIK